MLGCKGGRLISQKGGDAYGHFRDTILNDSICCVSRVNLELV
jgi:hypothetical protein